jgi:hypothetical protein
MVIRGWHGLLKKFKNSNMNKEQVKFDEQEAPEKNTDSAFVQVGADGKPVMDPESKDHAADNKGPKEGTLADR